MNRLQFTLVAATISSAAVLTSAGVSAADKAAPAPVAERAQLCANCHGKDGKTPIDPSYAILAGQSADYLVVALKAYKSGARKNASMAPMAAALSKQDIEDLAEYYSKMPGPLSYGQ